MRELRQEHEKKQEMARKGHGEYRHIGEDEFINEVTSSSLVACHFWHPEFQRSKIMDKHLEILARKYFDTKFIKIDAEKAAFFVAKLNIKMLPAIGTLLTQMMDLQHGHYQVYLTTNLIRIKLVNLAISCGGVKQGRQ